MKVCINAHRIVETVQWFGEFKNTEVLLAVAEQVAGITQIPFKNVTWLDQLDVGVETWCVFEAEFYSIEDVTMFKISMVIR